MTFSYYITKPLYCLSWKIVNVLKKKKDTAFYCDNELDYEIFKNIKVSKAYYIVRNSRVKRYLRNFGVRSKTWPSFPSAVIMARHALHRFPCQSIKKIGLRHGPYHFKKMIDASKYNAFDLFFFTSEHEADLASSYGVENAVSGGFPKLDTLLDGSIEENMLNTFKKKHNLDHSKKTLLFSSTWSGSGMSAVEVWAGRLSEFRQKYNILVTLHPFTEKYYRETIKNTSGISLIDNSELYPAMIVSDALVSDTSSIIAEYCALYKPIICIKTPEAERTDTEVAEIIDRISLSVKNIDELKDVIESELEAPAKRIEAQKKAVRIFFDDDKPDKGEKVSGLISKLLSSEK